MTDLNRTGKVLTDAENDLVVALSLLSRVKGHERTSKKGKRYHVDAFTRKVKGSDLNAGDIVSDSYGKKSVVKYKIGDSVRFEDGHEEKVKPSYTVTGNAFGAMSSGGTQYSPPTDASPEAIKARSDIRTEANKYTARLRNVLDSMTKDSGDYERADAYRAAGNYVQKEMSDTPVNRQIAKDLFDEMNHLEDYGSSTQKPLGSFSPVKPNEVPADLIAIVAYTEKYLEQRTEGPDAYRAKQAAKAYLSAAEDDLVVALAGFTDVKSYFRRTKGGKTVKVDSYKRKVLGSALKPGDSVKTSFGKTETVSSVSPTEVSFKSGGKAPAKSQFQLLNAPQQNAPQQNAPFKTISPTSETPLKGDPTKGPKSTGYDAARLKKAGNPGAAGSQPSAVPRLGELSDAEYEAHTKHIEEEIGKALAEGRATDKQFAVDANSGVWDFERAQKHRDIANAMWDASAKNVPNEGKAMISGGLGGAGKSTVLKMLPGDVQKNYFTVNSDDVKDHIASNYPDMIPEAGDLSPLERVALIHEESSHIADLLAARAYREKKNMIWDITMASQKSVQKRISDLHANGYTDVQGVFVDIDVETSVSRALSRHRRGMEKYRKGEGLGGRYVPPAIIRLNKSDRSSSANRETFEGLKDQFDSWSLFNNNVTGRAPVNEGSGTKKSGIDSTATDPFVNRTNL